MMMGLLRRRSHLYWSSTWSFLLLLFFYCQTTTAAWNPHRPSARQTARNAASRSVFPDAVQRLWVGDAPSNHRNGNGVADLQHSGGIVHVADQAVQRGVFLEQQGHASAAAHAFHEAAVYYQCRLDKNASGKSHPLAHVTALTNENDISALLVYSSLSLAFLYYDAMDLPAAAISIYQQVLRRRNDATNPDTAVDGSVYDGLGVALEASGAASSLSDAIAAYRNGMRSGDARLKFHLAVALDRCDDAKDEASALFEELRRSADPLQVCLVDSWGYVRWHLRKQLPNVNLYRGTKAMLQYALTAAATTTRSNNREPLYCEFGVGNGRSLRLTRQVLSSMTTEEDAPPPTIYGFDTFTGLPQAWGDRPMGSYSTGGAIPADLARDPGVQFYQGLFRDTIPLFLDQVVDHDDAHRYYLAYAHVDCRLYSSTVDVLELLRRTIVPGTILLCSEYLGHPTWRHDAFRALRECGKRLGWKYEYLAFSLSTKQAVVRITDA